MADQDQYSDFAKAIKESREQQEKILEQQEKLLEQQQSLLAQASEAKSRAHKDIWDRLAAIAPILSGTIIAIGGTYFTLSFNEQQLKLQEVQTIEKFIPHLLGDEKSKRAAILAISSIADAKLAAKVASIFASPGTVSALESIAENDTGTDRKALKLALARAMDNMAGTYVMEKRYDDAIAASRKALTLQEQSFGPTSPELVPNLNRIAELSTIHKDYVGAESFLKRSSEIQKSSFGSESAQYASQLRRLSALYKEEGFDGKSQSVMNQALAIEQKTSATPGGATPGAAADSHTELVDRSAAGQEASSSGSTDKVPHGSDVAADGRGLLGGADPAARPAPEAVGSRTSGQERAVQGESRAQDPSGKNLDLSETDAWHLRDSPAASASRVREFSGQPGLRARESSGAPGLRGRDASGSQPSRLSEVSAPQPARLRESPSVSTSRSELPGDKQH
jgi:hypothetical protein